MLINRREAIKGGVVAASLTAAPAALAAAAPARGPGVTMLRVCGLDNPLAIGDLPPRLSWQNAGFSQTAYRVRVGRRADLLAAGNDLLWDSGRVASTQTLDIAYQGPALTPGEQAVWQVEVWDDRGSPARRSEPAVWETGIGPWQGEWLAAETPTARLDRPAGLHWITGEGQLKPDADRAFRWTLESPVAGPAELCLSAHETQGVWHDGQPLAASSPEPVSWTQMAVYPVELKAGRNFIAVAVRRKVGFGVAPPVLTALLRLGDDLAERRTSADAGWRSTVDTAAGWQAPDFDDSGWQPAQPAKGALPIGQPWPAYPAVRLRRQFSLPGPVRRARLHATALGCYAAMLNGRAVGDARLSPEFTDPSQRVLYQTHDVTALLVQGENCLGFEVADGWYGSKYSTSGRFAFGPAPCRLIAQLEIELADGTRQVIATGPDWQIGPSPVLSASLYDGEAYDARLEQPGWSRPGVTGAGWRAAEPAPAPQGVAIDPQRCPPIRMREVLPAVAVNRLGPGHYVVDFGQNFAGWPRLTVAAPAGARIELRMAELLKADGRVDQANLRTALARDSYVAAGRGREVWEPRFTYHGFRYVELTGVPDERAAWTLEGLVGFQDLALTGDFRIGDPVIRKFWQNSVWSQKSNFFGLPTDCPQRDERLGWMGDAQVFWPAAAFNMDTQAFTARVCEDQRAAQRRNGGFVDCIPPFVPGAVSSSPGWADAGIVLPHTAWRQYGDTGVVDANWTAMTRYMDWIAASNPGHLWEKSRGFDYGDWLAVDAPDHNPGLPTTPKDLIATAHWARNAAMMAAMARGTGRDPAPWDALFQRIASAFNAAYVRADGAVGNGSQTSQVLAIRFGLLDAATRQAAGRHLAADIVRRGNHLSTGFLGTPHILDALADAGQADMAITLLLQRSFQSWGYMVEQGATTMWERWNSDRGDVGMNSRNHYAFGAIGDFLFRRIAGIDPAEPGFAKVRIAPLMTQRLGSGGATYRSVRGPIRTDWTVKAGRFRLDAELPPGVSGDVQLPAPGGQMRLVKARSGLNRFSGRIG